MMSILFFGFLLGMRHALEADHVAAVATLATRGHSLTESLRMGSIWGIGHTLTLFLFGSLVLLLDVRFSEQLALLLEFAVGVMLVLLGIDVIRRMIAERVHFHSHQHGHDLQHFHAHSHAGEAAHENSMHQHKHAQKIPVRALLIGMMHGMAGSAALIALTLQTATTPALGLLYILLFGLGSVLGMALLSAVIMIPIQHSARKMTWFYNGLQSSIGVATLMLGLYVVYEIGFVEGLLI